ncbi:hypothetical protein [Cupriavidus taiwanensis]|uniref:hypothetical protein n=1 Tax=Cupriavidus taiwanensis TaxID=164546 RepID=UPI00059DF788|nr:hypothetical protein [Cupriavidus taiwanensis]SPC07085.1 conserved exported hypothetical protein [Cupriavidus taiwanensis]
MNGRMLCQIALAFAATAASGAALAGRADLHDAAWHGGDLRDGMVKTRTSVGVGIYLGPGAFYGGYPYGYPAPYYYPPAVVAVPEAPPQYIEQGPNGPVPAPGPDGVMPQQGWWYHCSQPEGYYPYVASCPGGWQRVPAQPSPNS